MLGVIRVSSSFYMGIMTWQFFKFEKDQLLVPELSGPLLHPLLVQEDVQG